MLLRPFVAATLLAGTALSATAQDSRFQTTAPHAVIVDFDTGAVLFEKNAREPVGPSSMTKIMTSDIVFEALEAGEISEDTEFRTSRRAWEIGGAASGSSTMFLPLGEQTRVIDLLRGVVIQSGNDASIVLAEGLSGSESAFAERMTEHARDIGLDSATFKNSSGLPHPDHRISTLDLARLADHTIRDHPDYYPIYAEPRFEWNGISQGNRNPLLNTVDGADGLKTGHTEDAGYGLVASAEQGGERRIVVVNGLGSIRERATESERLMRAAFEAFKVYDMYAGNAVVGEVPVYMGKADTVEVRVGDAVTSGLFRGDRQALKSRIEYSVPVAPVKAGDEVATLIITEPGRPERLVPLLAASDVQAKGMVGKALGSLASKIRGD